MPAPKKPVVDERTELATHLAEHKQLMEVWDEGLMCGNEDCNTPVSKAWDKCPLCGSTEAVVRGKKK